MIRYKFSASTIFVDEGLGKRKSYIHIDGRIEESGFSDCFVASTVKSVVFTHIDVAINNSFIYTNEDL